MVDFSLKTPLQDRDIKQGPLEVASEILRKASSCFYVSFFTDMALPTTQS